MRIALMLTSLGMGGAERQVVSLAGRLQSRGHAVGLVTLMPPLANEWPTDVEIERLGMTKSPVSAGKALVQGYRFLRAFHPDIVHSHTKHANLVARLLHLSGAAPCVLTTLHSLQDGGRGRMLLYRLTDPLAAHTTAVSQAVADRYLACKAVTKGKCSVVTNAIDTDLFRPDAKRREWMRTHLGVGGRFIWLTAGRITPAKDYPNLLRAFALVAAAEPTAELWIAGEGGDKMPAGSRVRWLGLQRDMSSFFDVADGFVSSSAWEGMPLALGEAMAMEKSVVATGVGGVQELTGAYAKLVPPQDAVALADAMLNTMHRSKEERVVEGKAARARIEQHFGWDAKVSEWERLYERLLQRQ